MILRRQFGSLWAIYFWVIYLSTTYLSTTYPSEPFASETLSPGGQQKNQAGKKAVLGFSRNSSSLAVLGAPENQSWFGVANHSYRFGPDCFANASLQLMIPFKLAGLGFQRIK
jgi:hypothetical protein